MATGKEISLTLGAISKLYGLGKVAWKFYETTRQFGQDFETCMDDFHTQEWVFGSQLNTFKMSLEAYPQADPEHQRRRKGIANLIDQLVDIFNATYDIVEKYDTQCSNGTCTAHKHGTDTASHDIRHHKTTNKLQKNVEAPAHGLGAIQTWLIKRLKMMEQKLKETGESEKRRIRSSKEGQPDYKPTTTTVAGESSAVDHKRRRELRLEKRKRQQESARSEDLVSWAAHGKEDFTTSVAKLKNKNDELRILLSYLPSKDPFKKIRPLREYCGLWKKTETIRDDIEALHRALRKVNRARDQDKPKPIELAVKLETKPKDLLRKLQRYSQIDEDATPNVVISLLPTTETPFFNSSTRLNTMEPSKNRVGHLEGNEKTCHDLRIISVADELDHGRKLDDIIQLGLLPDKTRRAIAAKVAMAHVHFSDINSGTVHRHLGSYQVFPLAQDPTQPQNWKPKEITSLYVNFGFGQELQGLVVEKLPSDNDWNASLIDSAVELGILIFQIMALKRLEYPHTAQGLDLARAEIKDGHLDELERECGLFIREIVETCFIESYQDQNEDGKVERILAEVAAALDYHIDKE
ncbi:hypothetical protein GQX73_g859 [Xylaria multiplex]|uniref:Prion-inhibition and propagation HeLo domain-containing protein n=1 Tax=Xylaria multiplex TaxID=323545 RepID=A0A7C8J365_9PEZI|nr:hypothetical protein GQX73_g859 [Xylaria multiplex]